MKRLLAVVCVVLLLQSCKPKMPWSPEDDSGLSPSGAAGSGDSALAPVRVDIGDVEQGVFVIATIDPQSKSDTVVVEEIKNRRDRMAIVNVSIKPPAPEQLWANFTIKCYRDFPETPVVFRGQVLVDDKQVGSISAVIGKGADRREFVTKVDLLNQFEEVPPTFLTTVTGELLLLPEGTDEAAVVPETATSSVVSRAVQFNPIRVNLVDVLPAVPAETTPGTAAPAAPAAPPADATQPETAPTPAPADAAQPETAPEPAPAPADAAPAAGQGEGAAPAQ